MPHNFYHQIVWFYGNIIKKKKPFTWLSLLNLNQIFNFLIPYQELNYSTLEVNKIDNVQMNNNSSIYILSFQTSTSKLDIVKEVRI